MVLSDTSTTESDSDDDSPLFRRPALFRGAAGLPGLLPPSSQSASRMHLERQT